VKPGLAIARGLAAAMALLLPALSHAEQQPPLALKWEAPPDCPQQSDVQERIGALLASLAGKLKPSRLRAEGRIEPIGERYRLILVIHDRAAVGMRVMESDSCEDLGGAAAVALGLLVRVEQSSSGPLPESALGGVPKQAAERPHEAQPRPSEPRREAAPEAPRKWHPILGIPLFRVDLGVLPRPSYGTGLALGVGYESWRVLVGGALWWPQSIPAPDFPGFGARTHRLSADLQGCRGWQVGRLELAPCLVVALENVAVRGYGPGVASRSRRPAWLSVGAAMAGLWHLHHAASLVMGINGRYSTSRPHFVIEGVGELHRVPPVAAGATIACEWIF
jgi:hypothetical protein